MPHKEPHQDPTKKHPGRTKAKGTKTEGTKPQGTKRKRPPRLVPAPWFTHEACVIRTSDLQPRDAESD